MNDIKISVVVITYNQANCLPKALESLLKQKEWIYEIVISDDCSKDQNWDVITKYALEYPKLIKPFRNETNIGIYGNMNAGYCRATGNIIATLSGDDEYAQGCFEKAYNYFNKKNIVDSVFLCFFDRRRNFMDNRPSYTFKNNLCTDRCNLSYLLRGYICEPTFFSSKLLDRCTPPTNFGKCGDFYWNLLKLFNADVVLYYNSISVVYNAGIGVSVTESLIKTRESDILVFNKILEENEFGFKSNDLKYVKYLKSCAYSYFNPSWKYLFKNTCLFFSGIDISLGIRYLGLIKHVKYILRYSKYIYNSKR